LNQGILPPCQSWFGREMEDSFYINFVNMFLVILASWWDAICYIVCYFHWTFSITFSEICIKATLYTYTELELEESWFVLYQYINRNFQYVVIFLTRKNKCIVATHLFIIFDLLSYWILFQNFDYLKILQLSIFFPFLIISRVVLEQQLVKEK